MDVASGRVIDIFGASSAPDWCYYFEESGSCTPAKGLEQRRAKSAMKAQKAEPEPAIKNEMEYLPFIEGYATGPGDWNKARELTRKTMNSLPAMRPLLCSTWTRISEQTSTSSRRDENDLNMIFQTLECGVP